jgi:DNA-binding PadR family transcriptional regulator
VVLAALAAGEQTGAEAQANVIGITTGTYISPSSIYWILDRFVEMGLAEQRGRLYKLTDKGWRRLTLETHTMEAVVREAMRRIIASGHGRW